MDPRTESIRKAAEYVAARLDGKRPLAGIVLGSGLGKLADRIENPVVIPYSEIPGFPVSTAIGHKGNLIGGELGGKYVVAMQGRFHYYEGYSMEQVVYPSLTMDDADQFAELILTGVGKVAARIDEALAEYKSATARYSALHDKVFAS